MKIENKIEKYINEGIFKSAAQAAANFIGTSLERIEYQLTQKRIGKMVTKQWDKKKIKELESLTKKMKSQAKKEIGSDWKSATKDELSKPAQVLFDKIERLKNEIYG